MFRSINIHFWASEYHGNERKLRIFHYCLYLDAGIGHKVNNWGNKFRIWQGEMRMIVILEYSTCLPSLHGAFFDHSEEHLTKDLATTSPASGICFPVGKVTSFQLYSVSLSIQSNSDCLLSQQLHKMTDWRAINITSFHRLLPFHRLQKCTQQCCWGALPTNEHKSVNALLFLRRQTVNSILYENESRLFRYLLSIAELVECKYRH